MAKVLKMTLAEKFPDATENEVYKASVSPPQPPGPFFAPVVPVNPTLRHKDKKPCTVKTKGRKYSPPCKSTLTYQQGFRWQMGRQLGHELTE